MKLTHVLLAGLSPVLVIACSKSPEAGSDNATPAQPSPAATATAAPESPASSPASAEQTRSGEGRPSGRRGGDRLGQMQTNLGLSPEQTQKITSLFESQREVVEKLRADTALSREDRQAKMRELRQQMDAQVTAILTPEQKAKWDQLRASRQRPGNGRPAGQGQGQGQPGQN